MQFAGGRGTVFLILSDAIKDLSEWTMSEEWGGLGALLAKRVNAEEQDVKYYNVLHHRAEHTTECHAVYSV